MAKTEVTGAQVQAAAAAGFELLQNEDLPVPMNIAKSGALSVLEGMLSALAKGEVVLANPQLPENIGEGAGEPPMAPVETPPEGGNGEEPPAEE